MNVAVIFAGGTGKRMNSRTLPKQFLELHGKPILVYTLEQFDSHPDIDAIVLVCVADWMTYCQHLVDKFSLAKVAAIVPGGETGMLSRFHGLQKAAELYPPDTICLLHDGVRPLIDADLIRRDIECVRLHGSAVTVAPAIETIAIGSSPENGTIDTILDRSACQLARAPQCFRLGDLMAAHEEAIAKGDIDCIDTAFLMQSRGKPLHTVPGPPENIKITTPMDFYFFRAVIEMRENSQIFGV